MTAETGPRLEIVPLLRWSSRPAEPVQWQDHCGRSRTEPSPSQRILRARLEYAFPSSAGLSTTTFRQQLLQYDSGCMEGWRRRPILCCLSQVSVHPSSHPAQCCVRTEARGRCRIHRFLRGRSCNVVDGDGGGRRLDEASASTSCFALRSVREGVA